MKSPFQYGTLVDKESFVNRVEERKQLKELLGSGHQRNAYFTAPMGKIVACKSSYGRTDTRRQAYPCLLH